MIVLNHTVQDGLIHIQILNSCDQGSPCGHFFVRHDEDIKNILSKISIWIRTIQCDDSEKTLKFDGLMQELIDSGKFI